MSQYFLFLLVFLSHLIAADSLAAISPSDMPPEELNKYNALTPDAQAKALHALQKMNVYDKEHMHLDTTGNFFFVEDLTEDHGDEWSSDFYNKDLISDNPPTGIIDSVPILHSFPGAPNVIYLNFLGQRIENRAWNALINTPVLLAQPFAPYPFQASDREKIIQIWARVTESYAPWQVDVTTEKPAVFTPSTLTALVTKSVTSDGKSMPYHNALGASYLQIYGFMNEQYYAPALIYSDNLGNTAERDAQWVAHEIGHNLGLLHQGTSTSSLWGGVGVIGSELSWGCVMGLALGRSVVKFCNGNYPDANNTEPAVEMIDELLTPRAPSAGMTLTTATTLPIINGSFSLSGIIENYQTSNYFLLTNVQGDLSIQATTFRAKSGTGIGNHLCLGLQLYDSTGKLISTHMNPNSCSIKEKLNLPNKGHYIIKIYPIEHPTTPIPLYGSMGQYDLTGSISNSLKISPPYTTLALRSTIKFDANDTLSVSGGKPPYTYKAVLNSFTKSGTTFTYVATKPGLDTITVTDSRGDTADARVTVSLMDFGGMYGYSRLGRFNNPITQALRCPTGYTSRPIMGTPNVDLPLFYCYRMHADGVPADYDFGGIYSQSGSGPRFNPITGATSCPNGYSSVQVFGESSNRPDYPAYFCYKKHVESIAEAASFAGMYAPGFRVIYNHPITGNQTCPEGTIATLMLGTSNVDYPFYFCTFMANPIKISPEYTNLALNQTMSFDANDTVRVSGGVPPYTYSANLGIFNQNGTTYIYTASKPGLDTITVTDSKGNQATAKITITFMDFGGMYGYGTKENFVNPTTKTLGCPLGYTSQQLLGTLNVDYPLFYCYRSHTKGVPSDFDFGGMYSYSKAGLIPNPITGSGTCPIGYSSVQVFGNANNSPDFQAFMCYQTHHESIEEAVHFAGMFGYGYNKNYINPATGRLSCPTGWNEAKMLGTPNVDYPFIFCY